MTLTIEEETELFFGFDHKKLAEEVIRTVLEIEQFPYEAEINLLLVSLEEIQDINHNQRQIDCPTDVLSFPMIAYDCPGNFFEIEQDQDNFNPDTGEALLGDIVLCIDKVREQAKQFGHSEKREYAFLILHSVLHLLGYDHMEPKEAKQMEDKQNHILDRMGIAR